jgi:hypothetical protein
MFGFAESAVFALAAVAEFSKEIAPHAAATNRNVFFMGL